MVPRMPSNRLRGIFVFVVHTKEMKRIVKAPDSLIIASATYTKYDLFTFDKGMLFAERYGMNLIKDIV